MPLARTGKKSALVRTLEGNPALVCRYSGKLVHIDFGDCFEASMTREKFPERVPFRLTRMMVKAMEVCGTVGSFQRTAILTMEVLREERVSVMAMLEAFVHDPLINWRLLHARDVQARPRAPLPLCRRRVAWRSPLCPEAAPSAAIEFCAALSAVLW